jgi:SsrA-binding protein
LRAGGGSIAEAYAKVERDEVWLEGANIPTYAQASYNNHEPLRRRKLLLHRREIEELRKGLERRGPHRRAAQALLRCQRGKAKLSRSRWREDASATTSGRRRIEARRAAGDRARALKGSSR